MIKIENITKRFGKLQALVDVALQLHKGQCIALIGPNGCGKTTLIKCILGMVVPDGGKILFDGTDTRNNDTYRRHIGYMPQIGRYPENMTIGQVLNMIKGIRNSQNALDEELYYSFGIDKMLHKKMRTLSGGTIQKVSATLAFLFNPDVLILDEPTAGLDPLAAEILKQKIIAKRESGALILITSHLLNEMEGLVSEVIFMQDGIVVFHKDAEELKAAAGFDTVARSILHVLNQRAL